MTMCTQTQTSRLNAVLNPVCVKGASGNQSTEDLIKQPDFSDKIKQLLGSLQQSQNQNQGAPPPGTTLIIHCSQRRVPASVVLTSFCLSSSSQPGFAGTWPPHEQHEQYEHAHADAHEQRLSTQQSPWCPPLQPSTAPSQPWTSLQCRWGPKDDGPTARAGPGGQRQLLGR